MSLLLLALLVLGVALVGIGLLTRSPEAKARKRRLGMVRQRHGTADPIEIHLKRIGAAQATRLDAAFSRVLPNPELLRRRIQATGRNWTLTQFSLFCGGLCVAVWPLLATRGAPLILTLFLGLLIGLGLPYWMLGKLVAKRVRRFTARFPDAIELLVRGLRSGLPISETLGVVASEVPDPVGCEFRAVTDKMRIGRTMESALQDTADRLGTPEFQFFVITLAIQRETGGNLAETLGNLADVLRKRMQMKLKVAAMSSESKASAYIIGALPFLVFGMIWFINPSYMAPFFSDPRLMMAAGGGAVWMSIGAFIMAKMINFEL